VSVTVPPTVTPADATVEIVGVTCPTTTVSPGSPHAPVTGALSTSPEYDAIQRYVPAAVGV
jgi:hypothetical protein